MTSLTYLNIDAFLSQSRPRVEGESFHRIKDGPVAGAATDIPVEVVFNELLRGGRTLF